jgi:hypothetical protein
MSAKAPCHDKALELIKSVGKIGQWLTRDEQEMMKHITMTTYGSDILRELSQACIRGDARVTNYLILEFNIKFSDIPPKYDLLEKACLNNHFELAKWLVQKFSYRGDMTYPCVQIAIVSTRCNIIRWLLANVDDVWFDHWMLEAVKRGSLEVIALLSEHLRAPPNAYAINDMFNEACSHDYVAVVRWIISSYGSDTLRNRRGWLLLACKTNALDMVQDIMSQFTFTLKEVRKVRYYALPCARCPRFQYTHRSGVAEYRVAGTDAIEWMMSNYNTLPEPQPVADDQFTPDVWPTDDNIFT